MEVLANLLMFATIAVAGGVLFLVTGKAGPFRLPESWAKHCEACGAQWAVLHRRTCPKCSSELGTRNMFKSWQDWKAAQTSQDPVMQEALKMAAQRSDPD